MNLNNNTILITGGSSGLGLELSNQLLKRNNQVVICSRNMEKLNEAKRKYPKLEVIQCDITNPKSCDNLVQEITNKYPKLNVLVNNAAIANVHNFLKDETALEQLNVEVDTNFIAPIRLIKLLTPIINENHAPKIINITTGLIYAPRVLYPFYNATKAALHSFTQVLRMQTKLDPIEIIEVLFPAVKTPWHKGNPPKIAISTNKAINETLRKLEKGQVEIKIGKVKLLYVLSRIAPTFMLKKINGLE